jgi:tetratricopeptide (TPR) repeat protein
VSSDEQASDGGLAKDLSLDRLGKPKASESAADEFIDEQIKLARTDQDAARLRIRNLEIQNEHLHTQHFRERIHMAFDFGLSFAILVAVAFIGWLLWDAWSSQSVVIGAIDVPPGFTQQGLTGKVVASSLLDRLQSLQQATRSAQARTKVKDAWSNEIEVEIPEANISLAELQRYLHKWLGHDLQIGGNVTQTGTSVQLTVRGGTFPAQSFSGKPSDLPILLTKAAEYIYGEAEPYAFATYLLNNGRDKEAIDILQTAFNTAKKSQRPLLLNAWGNALMNLNKYKDALEKYRDAVRAQPDYWVGYDNMMYAEALRGHEEAEMRIGKRMEQAAKRGQWFAADVPDIDWQNLDDLRMDLIAEHKDYASDMHKNAGHGTGISEDAPLDAQVLTLLHDRRAAELELQTSPGSADDPFVIAQSAYVSGLIALDRRDYPTAYQQLKIVNDMARKSTDLAAQLGEPVSCVFALASVLAGKPENVNAEIARGGRSIQCYRNKAVISDRQGNWPKAETEFAAAVALAPSTPHAYESWGEALLRHNRPADAIAKFKEANARGPHWADPLKYWGNALYMLGRYQEAADKFEEAANYAPHWGALYIDWGRALDKLGQHEDALQKYRAASDDDLTGEERGSIRKFLN